MDAAKAREFLEKNHRAVMITRRASGGVASSPVAVGVGDAGDAVVSSRETAYKVRNLRRDPHATLCVFTDHFYGPWTQIEGTAQIVSLPEAMDGLVDYYRRVAGEHPDWAEYRQAMKDQRRVLIRVPIERAGPTRTG